MDRRLRRKILGLLTLAVWSAVIVASTYRFKLAAKAPLFVNLAVKPDTVRLILDGRRLFDGDYVETPLQLTIPPGHHRLKIGREGYVAHTVNIEGNSGDEFKVEDVVLERHPKARFAEVDVDLAKNVDNTLMVMVNDGFVKGKPPLTIGDLASGRDHVMVVYPNWPEDDDLYRCRFKPEANPSGEPYTMKIKVSGSSIRVSRCHKLKPRHQP